MSDRLDPLLLLSDEPIEGAGPDDLGRDADARLLAELALGTRGPFTIGVYGNWGTGKTSLLHRVRAMLEARSGEAHSGPRLYPLIVTVFFNAWQYEREAEPLAHLTEAIHDAVSLRLKELQTIRGAMKEMSIGWLRSLHTATRAAARSAAHGLSVGLAGTQIKVGDVLDRYEKLISEQQNTDSRAWKKHVSESATMAALRSLRAEETLLGAVQRSTVGDVPRVVVFIDDMDRCAAADAFSVLRGIKLALAQPGFVFFLSLNPDTLRPYVVEQTRGIRGDDASVSASNAAEKIYLDKLVQLPYPLRLRDEQFQRFAHTVIHERLSDVVSAAEHDVFKRLYAALRDSSDRNPRTLKRRINAVIVESRLAPPALLELLSDEIETARGLFMGLCLLEQTARHLGKPDLLDRLAKEAPLRGRIAAEGVRSLYLQLRDLDTRRADTDEFGRPKDGSTIDAHEQVLLAGAELIEDLNAVPPLDRLLREEFGNKWLLDDRVRKGFAEFLALRPEGFGQEKDISADAASTPSTRDEVQDDAGGDETFDEDTGSEATESDAEDDEADLPAPRPGRHRKHSLRRAKMAISDADRAIIERAVRESLAMLEDKDLTPENWARVQTLNLENESISSAGLAWLAWGETGLTSLRELDLSQTEASDDTLESFASRSSALTGLKVLHLRSCAIGDEGLGSISDPDSALKSVRVLDLHGTQVTDAGIDALVSPQCPIRKLEIINLKHTQVSKASIAKLKRRWSDIEVYI